MPVEPRPLEEVICVTPAMRPNCRSSGVATAEAMVSGLAPGKPAPTAMVGKSTCGSGATGKKRNDTGEQNRNGNQRRGNRPSDERRRKIGGEMHRSISVRRFFNWIADVKRETARQPIEGEVNDRRGVKRQQLAEKKAANDGDAQWTAQFRPNTGTESKRQAAEQRGHCRHHDGAEAKQAGFVDGVERSLALFAFGFEGKINHHDGVFLDDADEQDDANQRDDAEFRAAQEQGENRANAGGG